MSGMRAWRLLGHRSGHPARSIPLSLAEMLEGRQFKGRKHKRLNTPLLWTEQRRLRSRFWPLVEMQRETEQERTSQTPGGGGDPRAAEISSVTSEPVPIRSAR